MATNTAERVGSKREAMTGDGFRLGWDGEVFTLRGKIPGNPRWYYQCLSLSCRAFGPGERAKVRTGLAHLVKHLRATGRGMGIREYRFGSGSTRRARTLR